MSEPVPTMIVPTLNGHKRLAYMIESIDYHVNDLLIIDNGHSDRGAYDLMCIYHNPMIHKTHTVSLPSNLGVAASWNLGIKLFPWSEYWCIVNDDVVFEPGALQLLEIASSAHRIALASSPQPWSAFTIGESVVDQVGLFDEAFYPAYFEDTDFARRAASILGADVFVHSAAQIKHANSSTIGSDPLFAAANNRTYMRNLDAYTWKREASNDGVIGWNLETRRTNDWVRHAT